MVTAPICCFLRPSWSEAEIVPYWCIWHKESNWCLYLDWGWILEMLAFRSGKNSYSWRKITGASEGKKVNPNMALRGLLGGATTDPELIMTSLIANKNYIVRISKQFAWATHLISDVYVKSTFAFQGSACSCSWRHAWWDRCSWTSETVPLLRLQLPGCSDFLYPNRAQVLCCISFLWESSQGLWMWSFVFSITVVSTLCTALCIPFCEF